MVVLTMIATFVRRLLPALLVVFLAAACQAEVDVVVRVDDEPGAGSVEVRAWFDRAAMDRIGGVEGLRLDDLTEAGWEVDGPVEVDDESVAVWAEKDFADPTELAGILEEISGSDGPYARLGLRVDRSFARSEYRFEGVLDGSVGIDAFADPGVAGVLDGEPFGVDPAELEAELGVPVGSLITLGLEVELPGSVDGVGADADEARWSTTLDAADPVPVLLTSEQTRTASLVWAGVAAGFALLFLVLLVVWILVSARRRRARRRAARREASRPRPIPRDDLDEAETGDDDAPTDDGASVETPLHDEPAPSTEPAATAPDGGGSASVPGGAAAPAAPPPLRLVIIGGPGVAFGLRDPVDDLVAFARAHGSTLEYPRIAEQYAQAELGRISSAELWVSIGAEGDPAALDEELLGQYQLASGMRDFVLRARDRGFRVAYLGDGPTTWADLLRRSFVLGEVIDPWVVSAAVGARLPEPAMFEALRRTAGVDPASCLLIDDRLRVLEAAHAAGFGTAWYSPTGRAKEAPGHSIIRGFPELLSG